MVCGDEQGSDLLRRDHDFGSSNSNGSPHSRESELNTYENVLKDLEAGHKKHHGAKGENAAMWWM